MKNLYRSNVDKTQFGNRRTGKTTRNEILLTVAMVIGAEYNVCLSPKVGYFIADNFLIGVSTNLGFTKSPEVNGVSAKSTVYGIQAFSRYYLFPGEVGVENLLKRGRFFVEANGGISGVNIKDGPSTNGFAL